MKRKRSIGLLFLLLTGCTTYTLVKPGSVTVSEYYSVTPSLNWSQSTQGEHRIWTVDGADLESILFVNGVREGKSIMKLNDKKQATAFRPDMTESELVTAVADAFALTGAQQVQSLNLRPAPFGSKTGFRFELQYLSESGLRKKADVVGVVADKALYLIVYSGAELHYFPKYHPEFERIVQSIRFKG
ncbi:MAG: hypothetical protein KJ558_03625 [Gammaproteobacteria bacterium]|nr:hypothetical protein [Gammaproteobacteria bacterium]MBU1653912.1 hypothetical protein [Gammaproteobacteria bacterium]MBU1962337.1 hypothetical protein [Gammaproteobacteria bacterium]